VSASQSVKDLVLEKVLETATDLVTESVSPLERESALAKVSP
jgi:hypothetical protein